MAAALLGKCVGLLALVVLLYTCCYAFRVRDLGPQPPMAEQAQRAATCGTIFGRCTERTGRKWHEGALPRVTASRKPPVEVTSHGDEAGYLDEGPAAFGTRTPRPASVELDDDDDDDGAIVEVEEESYEGGVGESEEQVIGDSDEDGGEDEKESGVEEEDEEEDDGDDGNDDDADDDDEEEEVVKYAKTRRKGVVSREEEEEGEDRRKGIKKALHGKVEDAKLSAKKATKIVRPVKYGRDKDEEEADEDDRLEVKKTAPVEKEPKKKIGKPLPSKREGKSADEGSDQDDGDSVKATEADEDTKDKEVEEDDEDDEDEDDETDDEDEDDETSEPEVVPTPPPRKLEKVRLADKDKVKPAEILRSASPPLEKPKTDAKKPIEVTKRQEETAKKVTETTRKLVESPKKSTESAGKQVVGAKKVESPKVAKPESVTPKVKTPAKPEEKPRASVESEAAKGTKTAEDQAKRSEQAKAKKVEAKSAPAKVAEGLRSDKRESKPKTKKAVEAPITLAELNDAILHVPTFVPNFTAVEDPECQQHGKIFLRQLRGYKLWALQMLDSSAKVPSGLLRGNVNQLGDFDQCLGVMAHVKIDEKTIKVQGKYCLANIDLHASHPDMKLPVNLMQSRAFIRGSMRDPGHFVPKFTTVNWALCLPAACSAEDAEKILERALSDYNTTAGIRFTVHVDPNMCYVKQKARSYSKETIGVLYFYATVACLVVVATVRDYLVVTEGKGNYSERIIMSFSLRRTVRALLKDGSSEADITCIHGIRALVTIALYVAHQLIPISRLPFSNRVLLTEVANNPLSSVLRVSLVYTDAFLLLSGVLTAYNMANEFTTRGEIRWFCRFIARYIRLTPVLLVVVFWYAFVMEHVGTGPQWNNVITSNAELCKNNAWTNLLYIQNFFPFEEMCATHTHQLALDMQLSLIAPTIVFFLQCKPIVGILLICFFTLLSATLRYMATMSNYLSLVIFHGMSQKHLYKTANLTYALPLHRATPYVFGVALGVLLHYTGRSVKIHKVLVILGWLIAMAFGSWSLFSPWHLARRDYVYDAEEATQYAVVSPVSWALAMCWLIFACFTNNGGVINRLLSNYWLVIFSRISYAIYLTQFAVFFYNVGTTRYSTEFQPYRAIDPLEAAAVLGISTALTLLFDLPMQEIKNVIMESTDGLVAEVTAEKKSTAGEDKDSAASPSETEEVHGKAFEEDEIASTGWDWQKDIVQGGAKSRSEAVEDEEPITAPILRKSDGRRKSFIAHDTYEAEAMPTWDWIKGSNRKPPRDDEEYAERGRRSRNGHRDYPDDSEDEELAFSRIQQEREEALRRSRRSHSRSLDNKRFSTRESEDEEEHRRRRKDEEDDEDSRQYRRSHSRGRSVARDHEDYRSWEFVGKERSSSRGPDPKRATAKDADNEAASRQTRQSHSKPTDARRPLSSESEEELSSQWKTIEKKRGPVEPRVSDEEDWEGELRIRRKQFMEKVATEQPEGSLDEEEDLSSLRRRSSAEGRIALLKDPSGDDNMDAWTVSVGPRIAQLGSSQEPSEPEEDAYARRREYREQAPPLREDIPSEGETTWDSSRRRSYTSSSQVTSMEEDDEVASYNFVLTKDSKRMSMQDLSRLSQEETDLADSGWNVVKKDGNEAAPKTTSLGLFKRESIVKSQASEEDPEYLLPERPKLVQQEREHPFKKAWQMQKSRSEEDGSSAYAIKETKEHQTEGKPRDDDYHPPVKREPSGEQSEDVGSFADDESESVALSRSRSTDTEGNRASSRSGTDDTESISTTRSKSTDAEDRKASSKSGTDEDTAKFNWPSEDEQFEAYKTGGRRKSQETDWNWEQEET